MTLFLSLLLLNPPSLEAQRITLAGISGQVRKALTAEQLRTNRSGDVLYVVSDDGDALWVGHDGVLSVSSQDRFAPLEFHSIATADVAGKHAPPPICEWNQWLWLRSSPVHRGKFKLPVESDVSVRALLSMENENRSTLSYAGSKALGRGDGIAKVDTRPDSWQKTRTIIELQQGESMLAAAEGCEGGGYAYVSSARRSAKDRSEVVKLHFSATGETLKLPVARISGPMLFDQRRGLVAFPAEGDRLVIVSRKQELKTLRLPNAAATEMRIFSLAWEKRGTVLVGVRKAMTWADDHSKTYLPKLYRLDPRNGRFEYLGAFFLLGSSRDGSFLLIGEGPRLTRAYLMKRV